MYLMDNDFKESVFDTITGKYRLSRSVIGK